MPSTTVSRKSILPLADPAGHVGQELRVHVLVVASLVAFDPQALGTTRLS